MMHQHETETTWADLYTHAVHLFDGQRPTTILEQTIVNHFERHPAEVRHAIDKTAARFANGKIHSPWPIVKSELDNVDKRSSITASEDRERDRAAHLTEIEITNALLYLPTADELTDAVFGDHGRLKNWAQDTALRQRMIDLWETHRPRAVQAEADQRARSQAWRAARETPTPTTDDVPL